MMNVSRMSVEEIRDILFDEGAYWNEPGPSGRRRQMDQTFLLEMLKALVSRTERMMMNRVHELEWPFRCFVRIRQMLKNNIPRHSTNPYHLFMSQCLKDTREIYWDFDRILSRMRTTAQFMGEVDRKIRSSTTPSQAWNSCRFGLPAGPININGSGSSRGRGSGRGNRGASVPLVGVARVHCTAGLHSLFEQAESGSGARGRGRTNSRRGRGNVGGGASRGGNPGPSGSGSRRGGARGRPSGRDTPSSVRFSVHGRNRSPSRTPRSPRRESTRSPSRTVRPPRRESTRSRSRSGDSSCSVRSCDRSRSPSPSRSRSRTGSRRGRDTHEQAIDLSSGEYMETDN